jgi:flagellar motor switch protein FliM
MTDPAFNPALRKIIEAHAAARIRKVPRPAGLEPAVGRAVARTSNAFEGLLAETSEISIDWDRRLADALDVLPEQRLLAVLEGGAQTRALCVLENTIVDALIEVQTTGSVDAQTGAARPTTKIDAAIARDFIDFLLSHLGHELTIAGAERDLAVAYRFGTHLSDTRTLPLLLADGGFHIVRMRLSMGQGAKSGAILMAFPVTGGAGDTVPEPAKRETTQAWRDAMDAAIKRVVVPTEVVLLQRVLSLAEIDNLRVGDLLSFTSRELAEVRLNAQTGQTLVRGRLGQQQGQRAICVEIGGRPTALPPTTVSGPPFAAELPVAAPDDPQTPMNG